MGFTNLLGGYKTISNPDLVSERSAGVELGLRLQNQHGALSLAAFDNDYEDFIESRTLAPQFLFNGGIDPADGLLTFQSVNRNRVEIQGAELSGVMDLDGLANLPGFSLRGSIAYAQGEDRDTGEAINSIEPLSGVLGLRYDAPSARWGIELLFSAAAGKDENDIDAENPRFATAGYGLVDLLADVGDSTWVCSTWAIEPTPAGPTPSALAWITRVFPRTRRRASASRVSTRRSTSG